VDSYLFSQDWHLIAPAVMDTDELKSNRSLCGRRETRKRKTLYFGQASESLSTCPPPDQSWASSSPDHLIFSNPFTVSQAFVYQKLQGDILRQLGMAHLTYFPTVIAFPCLHNLRASSLFCSAAPTLGTDSYPDLRPDYCLTVKNMRSVRK